MVNQMLAQLRRHLLETDVHYSHWVVFGGVNDLYSDQTAHRTLAKIERDLGAIYAMGHERESLVVALTVAPWGGFHRWYTEERGVNTTALNQWIVKQRATGGVDFVVESAPSLTCGDICITMPKPNRALPRWITFRFRGSSAVRQFIAIRIGQCGLQRLGK